MEIQILHLIEGAKQARGVAVIIDVFRAFTVEAWLARNGAARIIPVGDKEIAYAFKAANPDAVLVGERNGVMLPGFDFGNSPSQLEHADLTGKTVIHTTSAGTQGIANASGADVILTGSLVNAKAIAEYIKASGAEDVSLVCMGLAGVEPTREDTLCAEYIKALVEGTPFDLAPGIEECKQTSGAKFFDPNNPIFPEEDFWLSVEADKFDFVLHVEQGEDGLMHTIRKV